MGCGVKCQHEDFAAEVAVSRLGEGDDQIRNFIADISVKCRACGEPFHFVGVECGLSFMRPMGNVGATTLHAPIAPGEGPLPASMRVELRRSDS